MIYLGKFYLSNYDFNFEINSDDFNELFCSNFIVVNLSEVDDTSFFRYNDFLLKVNCFENKKIFLIETDMITKVDSLDLTKRNDYIITGVIGNKYLAIHFKNFDRPNKNLLQLSDITIDLSGIKDIDKLLTQEVLDSYIKSIHKYHNVKTNKITLNKILIGFDHVTFTINLLT